MKSKGTAYLFWILSICGWLGFHRFYIGKVGTGILWIFTGGLCGFGALYDLFSLGGQVDAVNTTQELKEIRTATLANISNKNIQSN
nr:TM2 domain-containing protein [Leptospira interrogans]